MIIKQYGEDDDDDDDDGGHDNTEDALRSKWAGEESEECDKGSAHRRLPAAEVIGEHADHGGAKEDHSHCQGADPCYGDRRREDMDES